MIGFRRLLFLRHGDADVPAGCYPDPYQMGLSALGRSQANQAGVDLEGVGIDSIISSPYGRAKETALVIADRLGLSVEFDDRLRERVFDEFFGKFYEQIEKTHGQELCMQLASNNSDGIVIPGGESLDECAERIWDFADSMRSSPHDLPLVVSHGGPHEWFINRIVQPTVHRRIFSLGKCRLSIFDLASESADVDRIVSINVSTSTIDCGKLSLPLNL